MQQNSGTTAGGIQNLTGNTTKPVQYTLSGLPTINETDNPMYQTPTFAAGGTVSGSGAYDPFATDNTIAKSTLTPAVTKPLRNYTLTGLPGNLIGHMADGGEVGGHNPQFYSEGGLGSIDNRYVQGDGDGTSDSVPAMLAHSEFVIPADVVSALGNGSSDAGASVLDQFLKVIREHKRSTNPGQLPPDSKGPLGYLLEATKKAKK